MSDSYHSQMLKNKICIECQFRWSENQFWWSEKVVRLLEFIYKTQYYKEITVERITSIIAQMEKV